TVTADANQHKTYGEDDPALTYAVTAGTLITGDTFAGSLTRGVGEHVGPYALTQGSPTLSSDYALSYVGDTFTIATRPVTVTADEIGSATCREREPALAYAVTAGTLITGDTFAGSLTRAAGEHVGPYAITQGSLALT